MCGLSNSCHIWQSSAAAMRSSCASVGDSFAFSISFSVVLDIPHFFDSLRSEYPLQFRISQIFTVIMPLLCLRCSCMSLQKLWKIVKILSDVLDKTVQVIYNLYMHNVQNQKTEEKTMKKRLMAIAIAAMLLAMLTACGSSGDTAPQNDAGSTAAGASTGANGAANAETETTDEGDLGDYHVKILDAETGLKDYDGNPVIGVKYEYTNNGKENMMFDIAVSAQAFQDGVQLELAFMDECSPEYENSSKEIKTGATITCELYYELASESDVEIEVSELISFDDAKLTKTFSVAQ